MSSTSSVFSFIQPRSRVFGSVWSRLERTNDVISYLVDPTVYDGRFVLSENTYRVRIEVPGYKRDEITVETGREEVTVKVKKGTLERSIGLALPYDSDSSTFAAKLEDGILTLTVERIAPPAARKVVVN